MSAAPVTFQISSSPASSDSPPMPVTTSAWKAARRAASRWLSKPISRNEVIEVSFPEHEQRDEAVGQHQPLHGAHEHQHEREEAALPRMTLEIAARKQHDQRADARDQQREGQRQPVDAPGKVDADARRPGDGAGGDAAIGDQRQEAGEMGKQQRRDQRQRPCRRLSPRKRVRTGATAAPAKGRRSARKVSVSASVAMILPVQAIFRRPQVT